jgi:hypothetical protein
MSYQALIVDPTVLKLETPDASNQQSREEIFAIDEIFAEAVLVL